MTVEVELPAMDANGFYYDRLFELRHFLLTQTDGLLPCDKLNMLEALSPFYLNLLNYSVDQAVKDRLQQLINDPSLGLNDNNLFIQEIENGRSAVVNADYFPLQITAMPTIAGTNLTPYQLLEYLRLNINSFITDPTITASFNPYVHGGVDDTQLWNSQGSFCLGSLLHLDLPYNNGSVIVSNYSVETSPLNYQWTFTHPVSGHRRFGIFNNPTPGQGYIFYIGGLDRISTDITAFGNWLMDNKGFEESDKLWRHIVTNMKAFIEANGGSATYYPQVDMGIRPDYTLLKEIFTEADHFSGV